MSDTTEINVKEIDETESHIKSDDKTIESAIKQQQRVNARVATKNWNQAGKSDPLVGPGTLAMNPGVMQMSVTVKLHSRLAINLFRGRKGEPEKNIRPIIGLARFARQVLLVWSAASLDDPFADQVLLDIEQAYHLAKATLDSKTEAMQRLLDGLDYFDITIQASVSPVSLVLNFASPWSFRGMSLLSQFDKLVRIALTARHLGIFTDDDWEAVVHESQRAIRHMFVEADGWVATGVSRIDIRTNSKLAQRAKQKYMDLKKGYLVLDDAVMSGKYRAELSPVNRMLETHMTETEIKNMVTTQHNKAAKKTPGTAATTADLDETAQGDTANQKQGAAKKTIFGFAAGQSDTQNKSITDSLEERKD